MCAWRELRDRAHTVAHRREPPRLERLRVAEVVEGDRRLDLRTVPGEVRVYACEQQMGRRHRCSAAGHGALRQVLCC